MAGANVKELSFDELYELSNKYSIISQTANYSD